MDLDMFPETDLLGSHASLTVDTRETVAAAPDRKYFGTGTQQNVSACSQAQIRFIGTISTMRREGHFGFIIPTDGTKFIFVHCDEFCSDRNLFHVGSTAEYSVVFDPRNKITTKQCEGG